MIFLDTLVKQKLMTCWDISYSKNSFFEKRKKIKVFSKSKEILVVHGRIQTWDLLITSLVSYPLDHRGKLGNEASYVLFDLKLRKTDFQYIKCLNMSWVLALPMCQEILMVIEILAYKINKFKTGHPVFLLPTVFVIRMN